jgi:hypothetical protein
MDALQHVVVGANSVRERRTFLFELRAHARMLLPPGRKGMTAQT